MTSLVLVAHGSRDARAAAWTRRLVGAVAATGGRRVRPAYLDFTRPGLADALADEAARGVARTVVVPLLLTAAYHGRVDVPGVVDEVRRSGLPLDVALAEVLGPVAGPVPDRYPLDLLVAGVVRRLREAVGPGGSADAVVLGAAGTRDPVGQATVACVAERVGEVLGVPCRPGYAAGCAPTVDAAVADLRATGARAVALASYFLAPGLLYDRVVDAAIAAGAGAVAAPLGAAPEVVRLVLRRADEVNDARGRLDGRAA
ncbi:MAG TPA: CbiX/SirB N-terminal domain-containing protein [Micromonosporaceae bacterium]